MTEVVAFTITLMISAVLLTAVALGVLVMLRWLWRLADVTALAFLNRKFTTIKDPVREPEDIGLEFSLWSMPDFAARDHAAGVMLSAKKVRVMQILPHLEILLVTHNFGAKRGKVAREFRQVLSRTYFEMKKAAQEGEQL